MSITAIDDTTPCDRYPLEVMVAFCALLW